MLSSRSELADDVCPISDELLGELHRANDLFIPGFVSALPPDVRALLALFCYRRSHLYTINQSISSCIFFLTRRIRHDSLRHEAR